MEDIEREFERAWQEIPWFVRWTANRMKLARVLYAQGRIDGCAALQELQHGLIKKERITKQS